jgi:hypothetical protein
MKKKGSFCAIALISIITSISTASALSLKEKKQLQAWQSYLQDESSSYAKTVKDKCGYEIPVAIEEKFITPFMAENANAASYCDETRSQISSMCEDSTTKEAIKSKIKKIQCVLAKKEDEASLKLSGGTLVFSVGAKASNLGDKVKEFLENNL